MLKLCDELII